MAMHAYGFAKKRTRFRTRLAIECRHLQSAPAPLATAGRTAQGEVAPHAKSPYRSRWWLRLSLQGRPPLSVALPPLSADRRDSENDRPRLDGTRQAGGRNVHEAH